MTVEFDRDSHTYSVGGKVLPSVTQVLKEAGLIDTDWYTEEARLRGTFVHQATQYDDNGELDWKSVEGTQIEPYVEAWRRFKETSGVVIHGVEVVGANLTYGYAGTIDRVATIGSDYILDIKNGGPEAWHPLQTAAYSRLPQQKSSARRACVYLRDDATWKLHEHKSVGDFSVFVAALAVANFKRNSGKIRD